MTLHKSMLVLRALCDAETSGLQAGQIAGQPRALLRGGHRDDAIQRGDLLLRERRGVGEQGSALHMFSFSLVPGRLTQRSAPAR